LNDLSDIHNFLLVLGILDYNVIALTIRMYTAKGFIDEIYLDGRRAARFSCPSNLIPAPGQYLLAYAAGSDSPLAHPVYLAENCPGGFYAAPPLPSNWLPGVELTLRGPFGHGFNLPVSSRCVALAAVGNTCSRLLSLLEPALAQKAAVVLLTDNPPNGLPSVVEISPLTALAEIAKWSDYLAIDIPRSILLEEPKTFQLLSYGGYAQIFIETPVPCGGIGECGVCTIPSRKGYKLACKDGPVFDLKTIVE
jgi:dihydroorotate dehydrogenase electron transfer subunit